VSAGRVAGPPALVKDDFDGEMMPPTDSGTFFYTKSSRVDSLAIADAGLDNRNPHGRPRVTETLVGISPVWSPDGGSIAVLRDNAIVVHSLESGQDQSYGSGRSGNYAWFPDSAALLVQTGGNSRTGPPLSAYRIDLRSGQVRQVLAPDPNELRVRVVGVSSDNRTVFCIARSKKFVQGDPSTAANRIVAFDPASGLERVVFTLPAGESFGTVVLSPDGHAFTVTLGGGKRLARLDVDGTRFRDLYTLPSEEGDSVDQVQWSNDGRTIFFAPEPQREDGRRLFRIAAEGGTAEFTGLLVGGRSYSLSPDGSHLAYSESQTTHQLWTLDNLAAFLKTLK